MAPNNLNPGAIPSVTIGGRVFTDLSNLIELVGYSSANAYSTLRKVNASAGYQVPNGKTFRIYAIRVVSPIVGAAAAGAIGYGDTDVGIDSASGPTNAVWRGGTFNVLAAGSTMPAAQSVGQNSTEMAVRMDIPAQKYPCGKATASGTYPSCITVWGYEE